MSTTEKSWMTADQARELTRKEDPDFYVEKILRSVEITAKLGQTKTRYRECGFSDGRLYSGEPTQLQKDVMKRMASLGYKVRIGCEERQFVDIFLEVDWS